MMQKQISQVVGLQHQKEDMCYQATEWDSWAPYPLTVIHDIVQEGNNQHNVGSIEAISII